MGLQEDEEKQLLELLFENTDSEVMEQLSPPQQKGNGTKKSLKDILLYPYLALKNYLRRRAIRRSLFK